MSLSSKLISMGGDPTREPLPIKEYTFGMRVEIPEDNLTFSVPFITNSTDRDFTFYICWDFDYATQTYEDSSLVWEEITPTQIIYPSLPHTYSSAGTKHILFRGQKLQHFLCYETTETTSRSMITGIHGTLPPLDANGRTANIQGLFGNCENLVDILENKSANGNGEYAASLFAKQAGSIDATNLFKGTQIGTNAIPDIDDIFKRCTALKHFTYVFGGTKFTTTPNAFKYSPQGEDFRYAFHKCLNLTTVIPNLFENNNVMTVEGLFMECPLVTTVPSTLFDNKSELLSVKALFTRSGLSSLPTGLFKNHPNISVFEYMCSECSTLTAIPADLFASCTGAHTFNDCFYGTGVLTIPTGLFDSCIEANNFYETFASSKIGNIPAGLFDNCPISKGFEFTFSKCNRLTSVPNNLFTNTNGISFIGCFQQCEYLTSCGSDIFPESTQDVRQAFYQCFRLASAPNCKNKYYLLRAANMFNNCQTLPTIPSEMFVNCGNLLNVNQAFAYCVQLTSIPSRMFYLTHNITDFGGIFGGCSKITAIPTGLFSGCTQAQSFMSAFFGCSALTTVPTNLFQDCTEVTSFAQLFYQCAAITSIPTTLFRNCSKVTSYRMAMYQLTGFTGTFDTTNMFPSAFDASVTEIDIYGMFANCVNSNGNATNFYNKFNPKVTNASNLSLLGCTKWTGYSSVPAGWRQ